MRRKFVLRILLIISLMLMSVLVVTPAYANAPVHGEFPYEDSYSMTTECGFNIDVHASGTTRLTIWYDENGLIDRAHQYLDIQETWSANGKTLDVPYIFPEWADIGPDNQGVYNQLGTVMITLPGEGVVWSATGLISYRIIYDPATGDIDITDLLKQVGNWQADWPAICAYFAP